MIPERWQTKISLQLAAFVAGLGAIVSPEVASYVATCFTAPELLLLIGGVPVIAVLAVGPIDVVVAAIGGGARHALTAGVADGEVAGCARTQRLRVGVLAQRRSVPGGASVVAQRSARASACAARRRALRARRPRRHVHWGCSYNIKQIWSNKVGVPP